MNFRTPIKFNPAKFKLDIRDKILLTGSCFSEHIAGKMEQINWNIFENPHGILFNPASINTAIKELAEKKMYSENDLVKSDELWHSWQHHGSFGGVNKESVLKRINNHIDQAREFILKADCCILTYGSAWVYRHLNENKIVANCHKLPQSQFSKELLTVDKVTELISESIELLKTLKPDIKVILTLSPVRYLKDGFVENARSKAHLLSGIHAIVESNEGVDYFPSYEIFMDDLRDYRFNSEDLVHPNQQAIDYIWEQFISHYCNEVSKENIAELESWRKQINHRPLHADTQKHAVFRKQLLGKTLELKDKYEYLNFDNEIEQLKRD